MTSQISYTNDLTDPSQHVHYEPGQHTLSFMGVKSRYPCSGLAPVAVFHPARGLGGVDAGGPAAGVGEGAVLA